MDFREMKALYGRFKLQTIRNLIASNVIIKTTMNRLIIIGNGFDLAHDLETSYNHFMSDYFKRIIETSQGSFSNALIEGRKPNGWKLKKEESLIEILEFFKSLESFSLTKKTHFVKSILEELWINNWVDIEQCYFDSLLIGYKVKAETNRKENDPLHIVPNNASLVELKDALIAYLKDLSTVVNKENEAFKMMEVILGLKDETETNLVLNFNYTNTIENYLEEKDSNVIYIHGKLNDEKNPIIFGYGDDYHKDYLSLQELGYDELLKNQKSMLYPRTNNYGKLELFLNGLNTKNEEMATSDFEVLILGHSCGLSDRTLLRTIFEHKNCKKIHIAFHEDVNDFDSKVIAISRHFEDKTKMRSRVAPFNEELRIPQFKEYEA